MCIYIYGCTIYIYTYMDIYIHVCHTLNRILVPEEPQRNHVLICNTPTTLGRQGALFSGKRLVGKQAQPQVSLMRKSSLESYPGNMHSSRRNTACQIGLQTPPPASTARSSHLRSSECTGVWCPPAFCEEPHGLHAQYNLARCHDSRKKK